MLQSKISRIESLLLSEKSAIAVRVLISVTFVVSIDTRPSLMD